MLVLNINNLEELVFYDKNLQNLLPEFNHLFQQWRFAKVNSSLRSLVKKSILDFLNQIEPKHIKIIENYFACTISVDTIDYNIVKNITLNCEEKIIEGFDNASVSRDNNQVYICFWR